MEHPGEILINQFMKPKGISQNSLARDLHVPPQRINEIVHGRRSISPDTAMRLGCYFNNSPFFWLELQNRFDLEQAEESGLAAEICQQVRISPSRTIAKGGRQRIIEDTSLKVHQLIARKLQKSPKPVLSKAKRNINKWGWDKNPRPTPYMIAWQQLIDKPVEQIIKIITSPGEKGTLLRSSSPFEGVLTEDEKQRLCIQGQE